MAQYRRLLAVTMVAVACGAPTPPDTTAMGTTARDTTTTETVATTDPGTSTTAAGVTTISEPEQYRVARMTMVDFQVENRGISDPLVLEAMRSVPRHEFVPEDQVADAYADHPLAIGHGQTISQPYMVAVMSAALQAQPGDRVLEIGTGSGYQAAILTAMGLDVYTVEIIPELATAAAARLARLGYAVTARDSDGYSGWEEHAPFDAIIVTAAPDHVPQPLLDQLAPGGRMVIPIGPSGDVQTLWAFTKDATGDITAENLGLVRFVPLTRD